VTDVLSQRGLNRATLARQHLLERAAAPGEARHNPRKSVDHWPVRQVVVDHPAAQLSQHRATDAGVITVGQTATPSRRRQNGQFWRGLLSRCCVRGDRSCGIGACGQLPGRLVLRRRVSWISPPGCDCGFRNEQDRGDYAVPTLPDDFELAIWS